MHVMFPWQLLVRAAKFRLAGQSIGAQQSISGATTGVAGMGARWEAMLSLIAHTEDQYLATRGFLAGMEGMIGTTDVPAHAWFRPYDRDGQPIVMANVAGIADAQTMQNFGFANAPIISATLAEAAPLRATRIKVVFSNSTGLRPGHRFSIDGRLHEVQLTWVDDDGANVVQFQPPLRAAAAAGSAVEIHHPSCRMRLATVNESEAEDNPEPVRRFALNFVEAI